MLGYVEDWQGLLRGNVQQRQQVLRRLLKGRMGFEPQGDHWHCQVDVEQAGSAGDGRSFSFRHTSLLARHRRPLFARADEGRPAGARDGSGSVIADTRVVTERRAREWDAAHPREP